jgi:hypothetical protein
MADEGGMDFGELLVVKRLRKIDAPDLRADHRRQRIYRNRLRLRHQNTGSADSGQV